jgi:large subunit ribosomal protein L29
MKAIQLMTDLRGLAPDDLRRRAADLEDQVFRLRLQSAMGQGEAGHKMRPLRRELARLNTVLREKSGRGER